MKQVRTTLCIIPVLCIFVGSCWAQVSQSYGSVSSSGNGSFSASFGYSAPSFQAPASVGAPYCGDQVSERRQTLADGTNIVQAGPSQRTCRDSQGRTRLEQRQPPALVPRPPLEIDLAEITDPVAGYRYVLDPYNQVAHQSQLPPPPVPPGVRPMGGSGPVMGGAPSGAPGVPRGGRGPIPQGMPGPIPQGGPGRIPGAPPAVADPLRPVTVTESLGVQTIDGVPAEGRRSTMTYPAGSRGNDRPFVVISESWYSAELRLTILSKTVDPQSGEVIRKFENFSRSEPDPGLFQVPPGYRIVEETGPFTIEIKRP